LQHLNQQLPFLLQSTLHPTFLRKMMGGTYLTYSKVTSSYHVTSTSDSTIFSSNITNSSDIFRSYKTINKVRRNSIVRFHIIVSSRCKPLTQDWLSLVFT
jgi:hypothetical protein